MSLARKFSETLRSCFSTFQLFNFSTRVSVAILATAAALFALQAGAETVQIADAEDWAAFAARVNNGETTLDAELAADVTLAQDSPRVGDSGEHPYVGSFNGNSHTLTLNWDSSGVECLAPFGYVSGAKISDLHTAGAIVTDSQFASGLIGEVRPSGATSGATITRCRSSVSITSTVSGDATSGGFIGRTYWESQGVELKNCHFDGSLLVADGINIGGFVGFNFNATDLRIYNSLFAPENIVVSEKTGSSTFSRHQGYSVSVISCYYTASLDEIQGDDASSMSAAAVAASLGENWTVSEGKAMLKAFAPLWKLTGTVELLTNGEGSTTDGWTVEYGAWNCISSGGGDWFMADYSKNHALSTMSQTVTLADFGITSSEIQTGVVVTASVAARCEGSSTVANVKVYQLDASGNVLDTVTLVDRPGGEFDPTNYTANITLNSNTRKLKYELNGQSPENGVYLNGPAFQNCSLTTSRYSIAFVSEGAEVNKVYCSNISGVTAPWPGNLWNHVFIGYYTQETGGEQIFASNLRYTNPAAWTPAEVSTLYAQWRPRVVSFKFVSSGSTVGATNYNFEGAAPAAPVVTRRGDYKFLGYYTENGEQVYDENGAFVESSVSALTPDTTLYARWEIPEGSVVKLVYRGQLNLLTGEPAVHDTTYTKKMHFRVYDGSEATTPLWQTKPDGVDVTVNADGSFVHAFGDETLAALIATGRVSHVGLALGNTASLATELKPRRELRSVAAVNRALAAEGAALDIRVGNLVTENAVVAADATVSHLEVAGAVTAPGAGKVSVSPLALGAGERTQLLRGKGVKALSSAKPTVLATSGAVLRGDVLATAPTDGIALVSSCATGDRALRCPAVVQYCRKDEKVRAPTSDAGGLKVTFFPFVGNDR